jgi:hypothetical protein
VTVSHPDPHVAVIYEPIGKAARLASIGAVLLGAASLIFAVAMLIYVLWLIAASTTASPFDADGVRCYHRAAELSCIKTAEPAR